MKAFWLATFIGLVINVAGCGQKGGLVQPSPADEQLLSLDESEENQEKSLTE